LVLQLRRRGIELILGTERVFLVHVPHEHRVRRDPPPPPSCPAGSRIGPEDFVADEALPRILELIAESSRREAEMVAKWKQETEMQELDMSQTYL
jgi:hypothetical protein